MGNWALRLSVTVTTVLAAITVGPAAHADAPVDYVALGDSYSSGTAPPERPEPACAVPTAIRGCG